MLLNAEINAKESEIADLTGQLQAAQERWDAVQPDLAELARLRAIVKVLTPSSPPPHIVTALASLFLLLFNPWVDTPTPRHHNCRLFRWTPPPALSPAAPLRGSTTTGPPSPTLAPAQAACGPVAAGAGCFTW